MEISVQLGTESGKDFIEKNNIFSLLEIEPRALGHPAN
jgi:hypothetical protein